jgi:hypothetical protein
MPSTKITAFDMDASNVSAQTKKFTSGSSGKVPKESMTITGSGRIVFFVTGSNLDRLTVTVDGVTLLSSVELDVNTFAGAIEMYFEESVVFKGNTGGKVDYFVQM